MAEKACHDIRKVEKYVDSEGREVLEFVQIYGKDKEPPLIKGAAVIRVAPVMQGRPMPPQSIRIEFNFPDEVTSIKRAFEMFDEVAKAEVNRWQKEQNEKAKASNVVGARAMPGLNLLGPDGKSLRKG